jgi:DNA-binding NarL/FixJ family response regulator
VFHQDDFMKFMPLLVKNELERFSVSIQVDALSNSPIQCAFTAVAHEVADVPQRPYPTSVEGNHHDKTIAIRAIEPEYRHILNIELLTEREKVLQLIVDGYSNRAIADKLYITIGTVKTHVRNVLKKLYVSGRTQAAILALRSGLAR